MTDYVEHVRDRRGLLQKLEMAVPGFRGYRKFEDLRQSDALLRKVIVAKLERTKGALVARRKDAAEALRTADLVALGRALGSIETLIASVQHAEHGYGGMSAAHPVQEEELFVVYGVDDALLQRADELAERFARGGASGELATIDQAVREMKDMLFLRRMHLRGLVP